MADINTIALRRSNRPRKIPKRFVNFVILSTISDQDSSNSTIEVKDITVPQSYKEACRSKYATEWKIAMEKEIDSLKRKDVIEQ